MRRLSLLLLCAALQAQEAAPAGKPEPKPAAPERDALGFPVLFNEEVITRSDILRRIGVGAETLGDERTLAAERNRILFSKVNEHAVDMLGVEIRDRDIDDRINAEIEQRGSEAKFYESLAQRGQTLERYRQSLRAALIDEYVRLMVQHGFTPTQKILPFDTTARPREVASAFAADPGRKAPGIRVRTIELNIVLDRQVVADIVRQGMQERRPRGWVQEEQERRLKSRLEEILAALNGGTPFEELAAKAGGDIERQKAEWLPLPTEPAEDPSIRFLQTGQAGQRSEPLPITGGGFRLLQILETVREKAGRPEDPEVYQQYSGRIQELRRRKAEAQLKLRALDESRVEPARVREELRRILLADLTDAVQGLKTLGLH